jgi:hypothetical protein
VRWISGAQLQPRTAEAGSVDGDSDSLRPLPARRVATRYVVRIAATLRAGDRAVEGTIVDISASGALVECAPVAPGTSVSIDLSAVLQRAPWRNDRVRTEAAAHPRISSFPRLREAVPRHRARLRSRSRSRTPAA